MCLQGAELKPEELSLTRSRSLKKSAFRGNEDSKALLEADLMWKAHVIVEVHAAQMLCSSPMPLFSLAETLNVFSQVNAAQTSNSDAFSL